MTSLDSSEKKFLKIMSDVNHNITKIQSEEDAKIQIITRILTETLGWMHSDIACETAHDNGFSDYILSTDDHPSFVVEAKKIGILEVETAQKNTVRHLKISGSALKKCETGINQAFSYASPNGIPLSILTDGLCWVIFKTFIPGENFKSKEAIVFPSIEAVEKSFSVFYELLSKEAFNKRLYNTIFDDIHNKRLLLNNELTAPIIGSDIKITRKSDMAYDLERVFSSFFSRLEGDDEMMMECFVESYESRIADYSLEKITTSVLSNINHNKNKVGDELSDLIISNIESDINLESEQSVFIVGPTGSGKSTFLDRFFSRTLNKTIRERCLLIKINCLEATGREDTVLDWMTEEIIKTLETQLYKDGVPEWNDLLGLYHNEYKRKSRGADAALYNRSKDEFKEKFGRYLDEAVENDREGYLKRILHNVVSNRKMLPIIVVDNTDEFTLDFKTKVFQFSNSIKKNIKHCLVIFPVTDKSAWIFSKTDIFSIYQSKSFFLPTPSPREVFRKRINFITSQLNNKNTNEQKKSYLLSKGIKISIEDINKFSKVIENIFVNHDYTSQTLGELANYNIRSTLLLSKRIITSPAIKIEDLIKSYISGELPSINFTRFMDALIRGDYEVYKNGDIPEIYPIFQVDSQVRQSPLQALRILTLLNSIQVPGKSIEDKHLSVQSISSYFDALGATELAVDKALESLIMAKLIEPYDMSSTTLSSNQKLAISYKGRAHLKLASRNSVYFYQMALTTAITDSSIANKIKDTYASKGNHISKMYNIRNLFLEYLISEDSVYISNEITHEKYECQKELINRLLVFKQNRYDESEPPENTLGDIYKLGIVKKHARAIVDSYDVERGLGYLIVNDIDGPIDISQNLLKQYNIDSVVDGDTLMCDISRTEIGMVISHIYSKESPNVEAISGECIIKRYFPQRGYGFCSCDKLPVDIFFHVTIFSSESRQYLREGLIFKGEIIPSHNDSFQVRKVIHS